MKTYNTKDLMKILQISEWNAITLMKSKGFPSFKIGRLWRVREEDLEKWIRERKKT